MADEQLNLLDVRSQGVKLALAALNELGLPLPYPPSVEARELRLPQNLHQATSAELSTQLSMWSECAADAEFQLSMATSNLEAAQSQHAHTVKLHMRDYDDKVTVTARKADIDTVPEVYQLLLRIGHLKALERMLKAVLTGYRDKIFVVSREISRRGQER